MDPFTILILILLLFPFLRRIFEGLKGAPEQPDKAGTTDDPWSQAEQDRSGRTQTPARTERTDTRYQEERGEQSWEDFFEGLEKVLSGEDQERQRQRQTEADQRRERTEQTGRQTVSQGTRSESRSQAESTYRHPSHGPISGSGQASRQESRSTQRSATRSSDPFSHDERSSAEIGRQADQVSRELIEGDNPIYQDLDETPEVVVTDTRGKKYIKGVLMNPEKLRDGILIKEILGPPKSRQNTHHRF